MCKALWYGSQVITYLSRNVTTSYKHKATLYRVPAMTGHAYFSGHVQIQFLHALQVRVMHHYYLSGIYRSLRS